MDIVERFMIEHRLRHHHPYSASSVSRKAGMKEAQYTYTIQDMISDKIAQMEFALNSIGHFKKMQPSVSYEAPPLRSDSCFATWKEFRTHRKKHHITNKIDPANEFPLATFSMSEPGAITIIRDDCNDLLHILMRKNLQAMHPEYISSVFFAVEMADNRLHYMLGSFGIRQEFDREKQEDYRKRQEFHKKRTDKAKEKKGEKRDIVAGEILREYKEAFRNRANRHLSRNGIFDEIRKRRPVDVEKEIYLWSINTIRSALEKYHAEKRITLPPKRVSKR
jgi:hypothetical protein